MNKKHYEVKLIYHPQICEWQVTEVEFSLCADEHRRTIALGNSFNGFEAFKCAQMEINKLMN
jgi:hypothetical protein